LKFFKSSFGKGQDVLVRMINVKIETKSMEQQSLGIEDMFSLTLKAVLLMNSPDCRPVVFLVLYKI
jgi:hypothetical protein